MSTRRVLLNATAVAALVVGLLFVRHARDILLLVFAGVLAGIFLRRLATLVSGHTPLPPAVALALVMLTLTGAITAAFWIQGDTIATESSRLREELPRAVEQFHARISGYELGERLMEQLPEDPEGLMPDDPDTVSRVTGVVSTTFSALASGAIILFLGIVFAATPGVPPWTARGTALVHTEPRTDPVRSAGHSPRLRAGAADGALGGRVVCRRAGGRRAHMAGFTTVRDLGGTVTLALRDAIEQQWISGPRIIAAGKSIATTGGHAEAATHNAALLLGRWDELGSITEGKLADIVAVAGKPSTSCRMSASS